ncbi:MAG: phenylacetate--CoA ligase PaaK [Solirubrobacterales bacterium]
MDRRLPPSRDLLEPIEVASRDEIAAVQTERLKWSLKHAYDNVEHYRRKFDAHGVHPSDFKTLADLAKFPFTTKEDLRQTYPFGMFAVPQDQVVRVHASSGTTGKPTVVGYTQRDIDMWANVMARSIRAAGGRRGDKVHVSYGYGLFTGGLGAHYGAERLGCTVIPMSGGQTERQVQLIVDFKPDIIMVTPSYMLALADEMDRQGIDTRTSSINIGIFGAEPWTDAMRGEIEARMGMQAIDIYGLSEVIGPGVANECIETKDGLHIWEDHFYPEVINPETGTVHPDGTMGELVFTSLTKEALPVIRYRTRDLTRLLPGTARSFRRMDKITGRSDDMLIIRGVNVFPTQIEELILKDSRLAPHYQLEVTRDGHLDSLGVNVEMRSESFDPAAATSAAKDLQHHIKSYIGISTKVNICAPGAVERSVGKAKRVVDKRPKP